MFKTILLVAFAIAGLYLISLIFPYWKILLLLLAFIFFLALSLFTWLYISLNEKLLKEYLGRFLRIFRIILYIILMILIVFIIITTLGTLFWIIINEYYGIDIGIDKGERIRVVFYIFQMIIVTFGIFVGYLNFRELLRKNKGDHFPAVKVLGNTLKTKFINKLDTNERNYNHNKVGINITFEIENTSKNLVQIELGNIEVTGKKRKGFHGKTMILRGGFSLGPTIYMDIPNNLIYEKEKMKISLYIHPSHGFNDFKKVTCVYINLGVSSYGVKKNVRIWLSNLKEYTDKTKKEKDYKFELKNFIYE